MTSLRTSAFRRALQTSRRPSLSERVVPSPIINSLVRSRSLTTTSVVGHTRRTVPLPLATTRPTLSAHARFNSLSLPPRKVPETVLVVDLEATCWEGKPPSGERPEIIEIGWALLSVPQRSIVKSGSILVKPTVSTVSSFCTQLTSLTPDQLSTSGLSFPDALRALRETAATAGSPDVPWASWGEWDQKMFRSQCEKFGTEYPFKTPTEAEGEGAISEHYVDIKTEFMKKKALSKPVGLEEAIRLVGREMVGQHHRGVDDAVNAALILSDIWNPPEAKGKEEKKESSA